MNFYLPFCIFNESYFIKIFHKFGYEVIDSWDNPFDGASLPFHRDIKDIYERLLFQKTCRYSLKMMSGLSFSILKRHKHYIYFRIKDK